jgi:hypothetical protein
MERLVAGKTTVSDKIRALNAAGFARADIARFLGKRYQHVRNVLEGDRPKGARSGIAFQDPAFGARNALSDYKAPQTPRALGGFEDRATSFEPGARAAPQSLEPTRIGDLYSLKVDADGAVRLPRAVLDAFGLKADRVVVADWRGETLTLMSPRESLARARALVPQWRPGEPLWSDDLIAERRREAALEDRDV